VVTGLEDDDRLAVEVRIAKQRRGLLEIHDGKKEGSICVRLTYHLVPSADCGIEACSGRGIVLEAGEVEPPEVAFEVFCGDAAMGAQEGFEALVATVDGLDV